MSDGFDIRELEAEFDRAASASPDEREAILAEIKLRSPGLAAEVRKLLNADEKAEGFLEPLPFAKGGRRRDSIPSQDLTGTEVGSYRLTERLGEGGMGSVWLAEHTDPQMDRSVAIKVIKRGMDTDEVLARFALERRVLASLEHPGIARLIDAAALPDGRPAIIMEYIKGRRIDRACDERGLGVRDRLRLFLRVCAAVEHAHRNLVIHRDLKPSNIYVTSEGEPKLFDFGIAKLIDPSDDATVTAAEHRVLTPRYASPEQIRGDTVTTASDVYSLGVVLYELLTGRSPFGDVTGSSVPGTDRTPAKPSAAVTTSSSESHAHPASRAGGSAASRLSKTLRGDLDTIILTALHPDADRRYGGAGELAEDIRRYLENEPVKARSDGTVYRAVKFIRRNRSAVAAGALAFVTLAAGLAVMSVLYTRTQRAERAEVAQRLVAESRLREADRAADFLAAVIASARPNAAGGADPAVLRELLELAEPRIERELADEPRVRHRVEYAIGMSFRGIGEFEKASEHIERAIAIQEALPAEDRRVKLLADALNERAVIAMETGRPADAEPDLRRAIELFELVGPSVDDSRLAARSNLAAARLRLQHPKEALEIAEAVIAELSDLRPPGHEDLLGAQLVEMGALFAMNRLDEAEHQLRQAIDAARPAMAEKPHSHYFAMQNNLATLLGRLGDREGSLAVYDDMLPRLTNHLGPDHAQVLNARVNRASALDRVGRSDEAESEFRDVLQRNTELFGASSQSTIHPRASLVQRLISSRRYEEAEPMARDNLAICLQHRGPRHPDTGYALALLAGILKHLGGAEQHAEAANYYADALEIFSSTLGVQHPATLTLRRDIMDFYGPDYLDDPATLEDLLGSP